MGLFLLSGAVLLGGQSAERLAPAPPHETIYVAMYGSQQTKLRGPNPVVGIFYTQDEGKTWHHTDWTQGKIVAVTVAPETGGATLFAACGNGVMRTTDGGKSWQIVTDWQMDEVQDVALNSLDARQVFAVSPYGIFRSDDSGDAWRETDKGLRSKFVSAVRFDRERPGRIWAGTEAGLYCSDDDGENWRPTSITTPVRSIRQSRIAPQRWAVATVGRGVAVSEDNGASWEFRSGAMAPNLYRCAIDPHDANILYAGGWDTGILISNDFGRTWRTSNAGLGAVPIHGIAVSGRVPGLIFAGTMGQGVFKSVNGGKTWRPVGADVFDQGQIWDLTVEDEP